MEIKLFRLHNGEDILSEYILEDSDTYRINNPMKVVYYTQGKQVNTPDRLMISLMPWIFNSLVKSNEYSLLKRDILLDIEPSDKLVSYYQTICATVGELYKDEPLSVEDELSMMDSNEKQLDPNTFLEMLNDILVNKKDGGTLH